MAKRKRKTTTTGAKKSPLRHLLDWMNKNNLWCSQGQRAKSFVVSAIRKRWAIDRAWNEAGDILREQFIEQFSDRDDTPSFGNVISNDDARYDIQHFIDNYGDWLSPATVELLKQDKDKVIQPKATLVDFKPISNDEYQPVWRIAK